MSVAFHILLVALGSALGGLARYGVGDLFRHVGWPIHWATMLINITGSLFLGWFASMLSGTELSEAHKEHWQLLVAVGFTGGYTTFSSFEAQTYGLFEKGLTWTAIFYVTGSVFLGLVAFRVGMMLAGPK